jgi:hypothetical protein
MIVHNLHLAGLLVSLLRDEEGFIVAEIHYKQIIVHNYKYFWRQLMFYTTENVLSQKILYETTCVLDKKESSLLRKIYTRDVLWRSNMLCSVYIFMPLR